MNNTGTEAVIIRDYTVSQKDQTLKNKYYNKNKQQQQPQKQQPQKQQTQQQQQNKNVSFQNSQQQQNFQASQQFNQVYQQVGDQQIDNFLKNMEQEFQNASKQQLSVGMLNNQNQILQSHTEIMNQNQKYIAKMLEQQKQNPNEGGNNNQNSLQNNKQLLKELLGPVNQQIMEIKQLYQESKQQQQMLQSQLNQTNGSNMQLQMQQYMQNSTNLKDKIGNTTNDLKSILPENIGVLNNMQNFNIDVYANTINNLKQQITDLQQDCEKAEQDLESKYTRLSNAPKERDILEPYMKNIEQNLQNIDLGSKKRTIMKKLGGEFDYDQFNNEVEDITSDFKQIIKDYQYDIQQYELTIPKYSMSTQDTKDLNYRAPSILDEMKERLGIDFTQYEKLLVEKKREKERQQRQLHEQLASEETRKTKDINRQENFQEKQQQYQQSKKLKHLEHINTRPSEPAKDIKFLKNTNIQSNNIDDFKSVFAIDHEQEENLMKEERINKQRLDIVEREASNRDKQDRFNNQQWIGLNTNEEILDKNDINRKNQKNQPKKQDIDDVDPLAFPSKNKQKKKEDVVEITCTKDNLIKINPDQTFLEQQRQIQQEEAQKQQEIQQYQQNQQQQMNMLDKDTLKSLLHEVLLEREQQLQGDDNHYNNSGLQQQQSILKPSQSLNVPNLIAHHGDPQNTSILDSPRNNKPNQKSKFGDLVQQSLLKSQKSINQQQPRASQQNMNAGGGMGGGGDGSIANNFLQMINNTFAQINGAINSNSNNNQNNQNSQDSQGIQQQQQTMKQDFIRSQQQQQFNQPPQQQQFNNTFQNPYQMQQQPPMGMQSQFQYPQPMVMPQIPTNLMMGGGGAPNMGTGQFQKKNNQTLDLDEYYKEYQISDSDQSVSNLDLSQNTLNQNNKSSYAESIFNNSKYSDMSKSEGQITIPEYYKKNKDNNNISGDQSFQKANVSRSQEDSYTGNSQSQQLSEGEIQM